MGGIVEGFFGGTERAMAPAPVMPTTDNSQAKLDAAAQAQQDAALRGRTATILTGGSGTSTDSTNTSKILLGS